MNRCHVSYKASVPFKGEKVIKGESGKVLERCLNKELPRVEGMSTNASVSSAYPCTETTRLHLLIAPLLRLPFLCSPSAVFNYRLHSRAPSLCRSRSVISSISNGQVNQSVKE